MDAEIEANLDEYHINLTIMSLEAKREELEQRRSNQQAS